MLQFELVLPCYNESQSLKNLVERVQKEAIQAGMTPEEFQLVLVNNGSQDQTETILTELQQGPLKSWFRVVSITTNQGYGHGVWTGLKACMAPVVGWSHADGQADLGDAFRAFRTLKSLPGNKRFVKSLRFGRSLKQRWVTLIFELLAKLVLRLPFSEINAQPKVFDRTLLTQLSDFPADFSFDLYVLFKAFNAGFLFDSISVQVHPRSHGVSNWANHFLSRYRTMFSVARYMINLRAREGRVRHPKIASSTTLS